VVDDNDFNLFALKQILLKEGLFEIILAYDGQTSIELVRKRFESNLSFDYIFMDVDMPVMDGFTASRMIR